MQKVFKEYRIQGLPMPYTIDDFRREITLEYLQELSDDERLAILRDMTPEKKRLAGMSPEQILSQVSLEQIEAYVKQQLKNPVPPNKKKPKRKR